MLMPTWIILKLVPNEFVGVAKQVAKGLGRVVGVNRKNAYSKDQRFYIALTLSNPYETFVTLTNSVTKVAHMLLFDYNHLAI
jgi:hypothetical protein